METMRYVIFGTLLGFGLLFTSCSSDESTAPAQVQVAFNNKFPTVEKAEWSKESEGVWEAEFKMMEKDMSANFLADGTWLETETELTSDDLPQEVEDAVAAQFAGYSVKEMNLVEKTGEPKTYEIELEKDGQTTEALFAEDGTLIQQQAESQKEDQDKD